MTNEDFMREAIELAKKGMGFTSPNPMGYIPFFFKSHEAFIFIFFSKIGNNTSFK